jgi:hypothetical protein
MHPHSNYLEQELRQNLKLRRELGAAIKGKRGGGTAYRLGWLLYWSFLVLAIGWAGLVGLFVLGEDHLPRYWHFYSLIFLMPVLLLYGIGRALRYILSEE